MRFPFSLVVVLPCALIVPTIANAQMPGIDMETLALLKSVVAVREARKDVATQRPVGLSLYIPASKEPEVRAIFSEFLEQYESLLMKKLEIKRQELENVTR